MADSKLRKKDEEIFDAEIKRWKNEFLKISLWVIRVEKEFYFLGKEVGLSLGFAKPRREIGLYVDEEDKTTIGDLLGKDYREILKRIFPTGPKLGRVEFFQNLKSNQVLINEFGLYSLCMKSCHENVKPFQKWVYGVIKKIRITGSYTLPTNIQPPFDNPLEMISQLTLQVPKYVEGGNNNLRKTMCKLFKEGYNLSKNPYSVKAGRKGGKETQKRIREIKDSLESLKKKIERQIEEIENDIEETLRHVSSSSESERSSSEDEY